MLGSQTPSERSGEASLRRWHLKPEADEREATGYLGEEHPGTGNRQSKDPGAGMCLVSSRE